MAQQTRGKQHSPTAVVYDALECIGKSQVTTGAPGIANNLTIASGVQLDHIVLPFATKIYRVGIFAVATVATISVNFVVQTASGAEATASGTVAPNDATEAGSGVTVATNGQQLFASNQALTVQAANLIQTFTPDNPDAVYPAGSVISCRVITNGTGQANSFSFALYGKYYDLNYTKPVNAALTFSTDL